MLPSGVFFRDFAAEAAYLRTGPQRLALALFVLALVLLPALAGAYLVGVITLMFVTMIAVLGLQITVGMAGMINIGQSAFVGIGAFVSASLASKLGWPFWLTLPAAALAAGVSSLLFGLPALRIKGFYLALTTVAAQIVFPIGIARLPSAWFGGSSGLAVEPVSIFGHALLKQHELYYFNLAFVLLFALLAFNLKRTRVGRALIAVRDNDIAASVLGVNIGYYKLVAFFVGAVFAGVAGALLGYVVSYVTTDHFTLWLSIWYISMLIVGGMGSPLGAIFGTVVITALQESLHALGNAAAARFGSDFGAFIFPATNSVLGVLIIAILVFQPHGLLTGWNTLKAAYRIWPYRHHGG
ncbi:MAG: branched-chain amino acid ABC transporter permease [Betaproteobacteria bacterium]|nr:MAG: branched-chain amino acid ABC transporter permease [Betaproteobacteria bacterium]